MRTLVAMAASAAVILAIMIAAAPSILSTGVGRGAVERLINGRIAGSVTMERLSLSWTGKQTVEGLSLKDPEGKIVAVIERMQNDRSLLSLARKWKEDLGTTRIEGLEADLVAGEAGRTNLMDALSSTSPAKGGEAGFVPVLPFATLEMGESRISVSAPEMEEVEFLVRGVELVLPRAGRPAGISLEASTRQGGLTGELRIEGTVEDLVDAGGRLQPVLARVDLTVEAGNLPVEGIDHALGYRGQMAAALGRRLDLQIKARAAVDGIDVDLDVSSPHFEALLRMALAGGRLVLVEKSEAHFTITPGFVSTVARVRDPESTLSLRDEVPVTILLETLSVPFGSFDPGRISLGVKVSTRKAMHFESAGEGTDLVLAAVQASVESAVLAEQVKVHFSADLEIGGAPGGMTAEGVFNRLFDAGGRLQFERSGVEFSGEFSNAPSAVLDGLVGGGVVEELLGRTFNTSFSVRSLGAGPMDVVLSVDTPRLEGTLPLRLEEDISLTAPATLRATLTPALLRRLQAGPSPVKLLREAEVNLSVTRFSTARPDGERHFPDPGKTSIEASVIAESLAVAMPGGTELDLEEVKLSVQTESSGGAVLALAGKVRVRGGLAGEATGEDAVGVTLQARTGVDSDGRLLPVSGTFRAAGRLFDVVTAFRTESPYERITLNSPLEVQWSVPPALLARVFPASPGRMGVAGPLPLTLQVEPGDFPLRGLKLSELRLSSKIGIPKLALAEEGKGPAAILSDLQGRISFEGPEGRVRGELRCKAAPPGGGPAGSIEAAVTLENVLDRGEPRWGGAALHAKVGAESLPTALLSLAAGKVSTLAAVAGEEFDAEAEVRLSPLSGGLGSVSMKVQSARLELEADLSLAERITLKRPARFTLTLDPGAYAALTAPAEGSRGTGRYTLQGEAELTGRITQLSWPRKGAGEKPPRRTLSGGSIDASLEVPKLLFRDASGGGLIGLEKARIALRGQDIDRGLEVEVSGRITASPGAGDAPRPAGSLKAKAELSDLFDPDGGFSGSRLSVKAELQAESLPVALVDEWLGLQGLGTAALGESLDLEAGTSLRKGNGPLRFAARAANGTVDLDGFLREGTLRLNRPLVSELKVTEELGRRLLNKIHPIFETVSTSRRPLRVEIASEGFYLPLKDFDIAGVVVPSIVVDSNRLVLKRGGLLDLLIPLAQSFGGMKGVGQTGETEVWFTPLVAGMRGGVFEYRNRLDMLIDGRLHAISWGSVNLAGGASGEGRSSYDLMLGLPAASLRRILGTKKISDGEVLAIPLRGLEGGLDLKSISARATLELGRVRGQYELSRKDPLLGLVMGELVKEAAGTKTGPIPPPSVEPLPWSHLEKPEPAVQEQAPEQGRAPPPRPAQPPPADKPPAERSPEDAIREALPEEMRGIFDLLRKKR